MIEFKKPGILILVAVMLVTTMAMLTACGDNEEETPSPTSTQQPTPTATSAEPSPTATETSEQPIEEVTLKVGLLTDKTGVASQALIPVDQALLDNIRYFNEKGLFPAGVTVDVVQFDSQYDPSKFLPGYEYLKERHVDLMVSGVPGTGVTVKPDADKDKMIFFNLTASWDMFDPPGYIFSVNIPSDAFMYTLLDWVSNNDPDFPKDRPAKVGGLGMEDPYVQAWLNGLESYCKAHPDKYEWVKGYIVDWSTLTFGPEVEQLKDCDYIVPPSTGFALPNFMKEYVNAGHEATFLGNDAQMAYLGLMVDGAGWDVIDGMYMALPYTWWNEESETVDIANYCLTNYHDSGEEAQLRWSGGSYRGAFTQWRGLLMFLVDYLNTLDSPADFTSEGFHDYLMSGASITIDGNVWDYGPDDQTSWHSLGIFEGKADQEDFVRVSDGWVPIVWTP